MPIYSNMKTSTILTILTLLINISQGLSQSPSSQLTVSKTMLTINKVDYWENVSPINFIDTLIKYGPEYFFKLEVRPPENWFNEDYIKRLHVFKNDTNYCAWVMIPIAEELGEFQCEESRVNNQADHLIRSILMKRYPHSGRSSCPIE